MLAQSAPTIIWYQPHQSARSAALQSRQDDLRAAGFEVVVYTEPRSFYPAATKAFHSVGTVSSILFMISGLENESLAAISRLRMHSGYLPIMVELSSFSEELALQALYSGADDYCIFETSTALWVAKIECLLRRVRVPSNQRPLTMAPVAPAVPTIPEKKSEIWHLKDDGWTLVSPEAHKLALTTTERQFLHTLCSQADRRASHEQLLQAISEKNSIESAAISGHNRLGVVISRLKRKAASEGLTLPIRSIYKWGYMFGAPIQIM
ncbi:winged helix-turn-helix domain-containing protein [Paenalcaligenes hominis]|uniref:winged helix-turn-helix domain-containing protein n=1 Tax=Paenalcaligenes hominis TaxID=643674 RepID=UPI0035264E33